MLSHKGVNSLSFVVIIAVVIIRQVHIFNKILFTQQGIDMLEMWIFNFRSIPGPIVSHGYQQQRPWCCQCCEFYIIGLVIWPFVNWHTAFTNAASEEVS